jgi:hypothetical protein
MHRTRQGPRPLTGWRWPALFGVLTILVGVGFGFVPDIGACGPGGVGGPWASFQGIRTVAQVQDMIRPDCAAAIVPALEKSMWLDALVFIPVYFGFLISTFLVLRGPGALLVKIGIACLLIGIVCDQMEGGLLLNILGNLPGNQSVIDVLVPVKWSKEIMLALATLIIGLLLRKKGGAAQVSGWIIMLGCSFALVVELAGLMSGATGLLISWLTLAVTAILLSFGSGKSLA